MKTLTKEASTRPRVVSKLFIYFNIPDCSAKTINRVQNALRTTSTFVMSLWRIRAETHKLKGYSKHEGFSWVRYALFPCTVLKKRDAFSVAYSRDEATRAAAERWDARVVRKLDRNLFQRSSRSSGLDTGSPSRKVSPRFLYLLRLQGGRDWTKCRTGLQ